MKVIQVILAMLLGAASLQAQDTAPPLGECHKDGDLWLHEGVAAVHELAIADLASRNQFMEQCIKAYPRIFSRMREWQMFERIYREEIGLRALSFIARHNLKDKFMQEDAAGTR
jgi:hypothetical protein